MPLANYLMMGSVRVNQPRYFLLATPFLLLLAAVLAAGFLASLVPGWRAYRLSLADGLSPRT